MIWMWTWSGKCFGYLDGEDLYTYSGKHVGKLQGTDIYNPQGRYLGEVMNDTWLITCNASVVPHGVLGDVCHATGLCAYRSSH